MIRAQEGEEVSPALDLEESPPPNVGEEQAPEEDGPWHALLSAVLPERQETLHVLQELSRMTDSVGKFVVGEIKSRARKKSDETSSESIDVWRTTSADKGGSSIGSSMPISPQGEANVKVGESEGSRDPSGTAISDKMPLPSTANGGSMPATILPFCVNCRNGSPDPPAAQQLSGAPVVQEEGAKRHINLHFSTGDGKRRKRQFVEISSGDDNMERTSPKVHQESSRASAESGAPASLPSDKKSRQQETMERKAEKLLAMLGEIRSLQRTLMNEVRSDALLELEEELQRQHTATNGDCESLYNFCPE